MRNEEVSCFRTSVTLNRRSRVRNEVESRFMRLRSFRVSNKTRRSPPLPLKLQTLVQVQNCPLTFKRLDNLLFHPLYRNIIKHKQFINLNLKGFGNGCQIFGGGVVVSVFYSANIFRVNSNKLSKLFLRNFSVFAQFLYSLS